MIRREVTCNFCEGQIANVSLQGWGPSSLPYYLGEVTGKRLSRLEYWESKLTIEIRFGGFSIVRMPVVLFSI